MTQGPVVVDASVVVEYLVDLSLTQRAIDLFGILRDPEKDLELWAPDLIYAEVTSALRKLVRLKAIPAASGTRCIDRLTRLPITISGTAPLIVVNARRAPTGRELPIGCRILGDAERGGIEWLRRRPEYRR